MTEKNKNEIQPTSEPGGIPIEEMSDAEFDVDPGSAVGGDASSELVSKLHRSWLAKFGLVVAALVFTAAMLEFGIRVFLSAEIDTVFLEKQLNNSSIGVFTQAADDSSLVYQLRPNLDMEWKGQPLLTNATGSSRIPGPASESEASTGSHAKFTGSVKPNGKAGARIAVIGDSTPFGWGVRFHQAYPMIVHQELASSVGRPIALKNLCVPGYNTGQQLAAFKRWGKAWNPTLLIVHYDHNDAEGIGLLPPGTMPPDYGDNVLGSALLKFAARRLRVWRSSSQAFKQYQLESENIDGHGTERRNEGGDEDEVSDKHGHGKRRGDGDDSNRGSKSTTEPYKPVNPDVMRYHAGYLYSGAYYNDHIEAFKKLGVMARRMNLRVVVVLYDSAIRYKVDLENDEHYQKLHVGLSKQLQAEGFYVLDLYHAYRAYHEEHGGDALDAMRLSRMDQHPNVAGHRFIADRVTPFIVSNEKLMKHLAEHDPTATHTYQKDGGPRDDGIALSPGNVNPSSSTHSKSNLAKVGTGDLKN